MVFGSLVFCLAAMGSPAEEARVIVRLRDRVELRAPEVRLADIADLAGNADGIRRIAECRITPPKEGQTLDTGQIRDQLERAIGPITFVEFAGPRQVELVPKAEVAPAQVSAPTKETDPKARLEAMVLEQVRAKGNWPAERLVVRVEGDRAIGYLKEHPNVDFDLLVPSRWAIGSQRATLEIPGPPKIEFPLTVAVALERRVVVARRALPRGAQVTEADVALLPPPVLGGEGELLEELALAIGKEARGPIAAGQPLGRKDLKGVLLVTRGSPVTVWCRYNTAVIQMTATANDDGELGDWIEVTNPSSRQPLLKKVRVIGMSSAEFLPTGPPSRAAGNKAIDRSRQGKRP